LNTPLLKTCEKFAAVELDVTGLRKIQMDHVNSIPSVSFTERMIGIDACEDGSWLIIMGCVASAIPDTSVIFWLGANNHDKREMEIRKRIKNKIITSNKNAVLAISVFDSRKSLVPDTSVDDPKEDVNLDKYDGEDPDDDDDDDEFEK
jgi:hypothetical protein